VATTEDARFAKAIDRFQHSPAAKQLAALGVDYRLVPHAEGVSWAEEFARAAGIPLDRVFKTMLLKDSGSKYFLLICPAAERVDFDLLREQFGANQTLAKRDEVSAVTRHLPTSVSPIGIKRPLSLYADARLFHGDLVYLGSGPQESILRSKHRACLVHSGLRTSNEAIMTNSVLG
jgi:prolyl-tRNA editing enzyme YbaK/EbsC (Cys-tRNA(Pro) deacylase)